MLAAESSCKNPLPHAEGSARKAGHGAPARLPEHFLSSSVKTLRERGRLGLRMGARRALGSVAQASSRDQGALSSGLPRHEWSLRGQPWSVGVLEPAGACHLYVVIQKGSSSWGSSNLSSISSAMEASCMAR